MYSSNSLAKKLLEEASEYLNIAAAQGQDIRMEKAFILLLRGQMTTPVDENTLATVQESLALFKELGRTWEAGWVHNSLGLLNIYFSRFQNAIEHFEKSMTMLEIVGDRKLIRPKIDMASCMSALGRNEEAEKVVRSAIASAQAINDDIHMADGLVKMSEILSNAGRFNEAMAAMDRGLEYYTNLGRGPLEIESWTTNQYNIVLHLGQYKKLYERAQEILNSISSDNRHYNSLAHFWMGSILLAKGHYIKAQSHLEENLRKNQGLNWTDRIATSHALLGYTAVFFGNHADAKVHLSEALRSNSIIPRLYALPILALLYFDLGDNIRAIELYSLANQYGFVANSKWFNDVAQNKYEARMEALVGVVQDKMIATAQERGRSLDLFETAESLLQELTSEQES